MPHKFFVALAGVILVTMASCHKETSIEGVTGKNVLQGDWTLVSVHAQSQATEQDTVNGVVYTVLTVSNYTTTDNTGMVSFSADSMSGAGIGYSIADTSIEYDYINGGFLDSTAYPLGFTVPAANSSSFYQLVGTDSLSFPQGSNLISVPVIPGAPSGSVSGAKFVISGNTLTMTSVVDQTVLVPILGVMEPLLVRATVTIILQRQ
jgi:hypothetical protein